ncbi:MAG: sortase [Candidatus Daviesbacteria bacterium]|nr:sortase [Candidatus Daviesbacteria bacterium]
MSSRFRFILLIRFLGYLAFFVGLTSFVFMLGPLVQVEFDYRKDKILNIKRTVPRMISPTSGESGPTPEVSDKPTSEVSDAGGPVSFDNVETSENSIIPVSTEYGIVIEKINANAKIIPNVNPANEREYTKALAGGVAEALGSTTPGQPGNLYLFSHSTDAPWNIVRFNAVFYLLKELDKGDSVIIFYKNKRYDYVVFDKIIVRPDDVSYLTNKYDFPVLTLQTCDPPGTLLNRLIIRARLVNS